MDIKTDPVVTSAPLLPIAGCNAGDLEASDAGSVPATSTPATEPLHDQADGAGALQAKAEASETPAPTPPQTLREFEAALRGLGFSRKQAASIAKHGFTQASDADETDDGDSEKVSEVLAALRRRTESLNKF